MGQRGNKGSGEHGISLFSSLEVPYMPWFSHHAGYAGGWRITPPAMSPLCRRLNNPYPRLPFSSSARDPLDVILPITTQSPIGPSDP
jgi:hypothetical protein